ncbi:MAG: oxygen-independent coproporphyrinogen III oxidase, partial [Bdellovibrionaceae bacterium]|nr:oxygen-independent coproporphyrinogen III oxidase [Pseudobdellovibrionaceae bacterium]
MQTDSLFKKYDLPVPRYTSYPTVPYWSITPSEDQWIQHLNTALSTEQSSWSMYLHIPYCETLCTFCGCNTIITKNHNLENFYVDLLLKEWEIYKQAVPAFTTKPLKQLHLGGGTPTFLSAEALTRLLSTILNDVIKDKNFEASIEVDPRRTNKEQLKALKDVGFNRVSMGVQDFNHEVQRLINRVQPYDITKNLTQDARDLGFGSVNYDLIYGLAKQTLVSFGDTIDKTIELRPDRIALYSFALVPWIKPAQRLFKDEDLPVADDKRKLYELARTKLTAAGYIEIGMDHFALPDENLSLALKNKTLHRNFMGYTDHKTDVLLGLGISSISESPYSFHQNEKVSSLY